MIHFRILLLSTSNDGYKLSKLHTKGIYWVHHIAGITEDMTLDDVCDKIKGHRLALTLFRNKGAVEAQISTLKTDAEILFKLYEMETQNLISKIK